MSKLLIINGISYDVPSKKLEYAIDTQFNYFKFPPRIKPLTANDAINLGDALDDIDIVTGRYIISSETGIPARDGSNKIIYRGGEYDDSNISDYFNNPLGNPAGYKMYFAKNDVLSTPLGAWVKPTLLDINTPINGNELIKPGKFIITPDMINTGENIYFSIRVTLRVDGSREWIDHMLSINPLEQPAPVPDDSADPTQTVGVYVEGRSDAQKAADIRQAALMAQLMQGQNTGQAYQPSNPTAYSTVYTDVPEYDRFSPYNVSADPNIVSIGIKNTVLIELNVNRVDDLPGDTYINEGAYAGTFAPISRISDFNWPIIGDDSTLLGYINDIKTLDIEYNTLLVEYNNMQTLISNRSTLTELNDLAAKKLAVDNALAQLENAQTIMKNAQIKVKQERHDWLTNTTSTGKNYNVTNITPIQPYMVDRLMPENHNTSTMGYQILYMVDIKTAKPWDEYYITTACGSPYNLIYKDNTYWDVVPQSKLATIFK